MVVVEDTVAGVATAVAAVVMVEAMAEGAVEAKATRAHGNTERGLVALVIPGKEARDMTPTILQDNKEWVAAGEDGEAL